ncbi:MAG: GNAT family N-acetyltransferase [Gemmatimonadota bacterium]
MTSSRFHVRPLGPADAAAFQAFRLRALREAPEAFGSTYDEEVGLPLETVAGLLAPADGPPQVVLGAFSEGGPGGDALVGMVVCHRERRTKARHKASVGGMFVAPEARGLGIGRALLERVIAEARSWEGVEKLTLTVVERATAARALYRAVGFRPYGLEPDSLRQDGVRDTVEYLALDLVGRG